MRRRFRFRRRRTNWGRVRRAVRRVTGIILAKRVLAINLTVPDVTAADFDNPLTVDLLECIEAQDESVESDGSAVADCPLYSRIVSLKIQATLSTGGVAHVVRWMLFKNPDGDLTAASAMTNFHTSDDTDAARNFRKYTLVKGQLRLPSDRLQTRLPIRISRSAWKRVGQMREGDKLTLVIAKEAVGTTDALDLMGTVYVRANA